MRRREGGTNGSAILPAHSHSLCKGGCFDTYKSRRQLEIDLPRHVRRPHSLVMEWKEERNMIIVGPVSCRIQFSRYQTVGLNACRGKSKSKQTISPVSALLVLHDGWTDNIDAPFSFTLENC